jgi:hypothetical protein
MRRFFFQPLFFLLPVAPRSNRQRICAEPLLTRSREDPQLSRILRSMFLSVSNIHWSDWFYICSSGPEESSTYALAPLFAIAYMMYSLNDVIDAQWRVQKKRCPALIHVSAYL